MSILPGGNLDLKNFLLQKLDQALTGDILGTGVVGFVPIKIYSSGIESKYESDISNIINNVNALGSDGALMKKPIHTFEFYIKDIKASTYSLGTAEYLADLYIIHLLYSAGNVQRSPITFLKQFLNVTAWAEAIAELKGQEVKKKENKEPFKLIDDVFSVIQKITQPINTVLSAWGYLEEESPITYVDKTVIKYIIRNVFETYVRENLPSISKGLYSTIYNAATTFDVSTGKNAASGILSLFGEFISASMEQQLFLLTFLKYSNRWLKDKLPICLPLAKGWVTGDFSYNVISYDPKARNIFKGKMTITQSYNIPATFVRADLKPKQTAVAGQDERVLTTSSFNLLTNEQIRIALAKAAEDLKQGGIKSSSPLPLNSSQEQLNLLNNPNYNKDSPTAPDKNKKTSSLPRFGKGG